MERIASRIYAESNQPLGRSQIDCWLNEAGLERVTFYDGVALYLAQGFDSSVLSFEFCDEVANYVWVDMIDSHQRDPDNWSEMFFHVYCAFDEGEWSWPGDPHDPVEVYTRPILAHFLTWHAAHGTVYFELRRDLYACQDLEERRRMKDSLSSLFKSAILSMPRR